MNPAMKSRGSKASPNFFHVSLPHRLIFPFCVADLACFVPFIVTFCSIPNLKHLIIALILGVCMPRYSRCRRRFLGCHHRLRPCFAYSLAKDEIAEWPESESTENAFERPPNATTALAESLGEERWSRIIVIGS